MNPPVEHNIIFVDNPDWINLSYQELSKLSDEILLCNSTIIMDLPNHYIVHKKCSETQCELFLTMMKTNDRWEFVRGYLYQDGKEIAIKEYTMYKSIQMGEWCFDNLGICVISINCIKK